jgi:hypothetical protein
MNSGSPQSVVDLKIASTRPATLALWTLASVVTERAVVYFLSGEGGGIKSQSPSSLISFSLQISCLHFSQHYKLLHRIIRYVFSIGVFALQGGVWISTFPWRWDFLCQSRINFASLFYKLLRANFLSSCVSFEQYPSPLHHGASSSSRPVGLGRTKKENTSFPCASSSLEEIYAIWQQTT